MTNDSTINGASSTSQAVTQSNTTTNSSNSNSTTSAATANALGQDEFLTLLISQLQNQDPLDPMKNEEFAVQLAQFSQVEQLIEINDTLANSGSTGANIASSMASYLGHDVVLNGNSVTVAQAESSDILLDIPAGTQSIRFDFIDEQGTVVGRHTVDEFETGSSTVPLEGLLVPDGEYELRAVSVNANGEFVDLDAKLSGTVEGFILEPEPRLIVGGQEISVDDIKEVRASSS